MCVCIPHSIFQVHRGIFCNLVEVYTHIFFADSVHKSLHEMKPQFHIYEFASRCVPGLKSCCLCKIFSPMKVGSVITLIRDVLQNVLKCLHMTGFVFTGHVICLCGPVVRHLIGNREDLCLTLGTEREIYGGLGNLSKDGPLSLHPISQ